MLSRRVLCAAASVLLLGPAVLPTRAQEPATPTGPMLHVTTQIVVLDVVVTDRKGRLVQRSLSKDDFTVVDAGVPQTIRHFETPDQHAMPSAQGGVVHSAADLAKIGDAPVTILVIDELNGRFEDMSYARQMLVKYLQSQPPVLPNPAVLMLASNTTFQQLHDYTQDRDELIRIVKKHVPEMPYKANSRGGPVAVERLAQVLSALQQIAESSTGTPGRKNLVWVGNGFPTANIVGLPQDEADKIEAAIRRVTTRLLAARVTVYTINPTLASTATVDVEDTDDLSTAADENGGDPFGGGTLSFSNLAPSTGGMAFTGRNDLNNLIATGIDQGRNYYTLAYTPTQAVDAAAYRRVKVILRDPNLRAETRAGYYPQALADLNPVVDKTLTQKQVMANLRLDLSNALTTAISYNGLQVTATPQGSEYVLHVAEPGIGWSDADASGKSSAEATVAAGWYDVKGKLLGHVVHEEMCPRGTGGNGAEFRIAVQRPPNAVRIRFVVRDARNGHMGTADIR